MFMNESQRGKRSSNIYFSTILTRIVVWITLYVRDRFTEALGAAMDARCVENISCSFKSLKIG